MPIFEYKCTNCNNKFEVLHKTSTKTEEVTCPNCNSSKNKKLFSAFNASVESSSYNGSNCSTGNCSAPEPVSGGCASGNCGLN
jgi:putative FmdB family regulatory protein